MAIAETDLPITEYGDGDRRSSSRSLRRRQDPSLTNVRTSCADLRLCRSRPSSPKLVGGRDEPPRSMLVMHAGAVYQPVSWIGGASLPAGMSTVSSFVRPSDSTARSLRRPALTGRL